ncbi:uncharacterized protein LOC128964322 [Oppia nitens]|uniref:uncharacterized protein LOC128964322 n=1 Tax=Oppia nitens TaxID=1686743 RepID=UPI0023DC2BC7|nr:uncharacterized protein LOC128964322 [Oppia nitens]
MSLKIVFLVVCLQISVSLTLKSCQIREIDSCFISFVSTFDSNRPLPESQEQTQEFCKNINKTQECLEKYEKRCFSSLQSETIRWMSRPFAKIQTTLCPTPTTSPATLEQNQCLNSVLKSENCFQRLNTSLMNSISNEFKGKRFSTFCCSFSFTENCIQNKSKTLCPQKHPILPFLRQTLEMFCGKSSEFCPKEDISPKETQLSFDFPLIARSLAAIFGN